MCIRDRSLTATIVAVIKLFVIQSEQVQDCGVIIRYFSAIDDRAVTKFIGFTIRLPTPDPATGHPDTVPVGMMVAPLVSASRIFSAQLRSRRPPKLPTPQH